MPIRATVWHIAGEEGPIITIHPHWGADNGYETATFPTRDEAIAFAEKRWGCSLDEILVKP